MGQKGISLNSIANLIFSIKFREKNDKLVNNSQKI